MNIQESRKLAQDETTGSEILANFATNEDYKTRKYVALNPNTSIQVLLDLSFDFPQEVMKNPVIPLLLLENPYVLTCEIHFDFNQIKRLTDIEIKRLGWTKDKGKEHLLKN
jgi:hypothetical protein